MAFSALRRVLFHGDAAARGPAEHLAALRALLRRGLLSTDSYACGGSVELVERKMAAALGKPAAVFFPTGTLANLFALKHLCGESRRVLVQADSHVARDAGDGAARLAGLTLVPLAAGRPAPAPDELAEAVAQARENRVATKVGAFSLELPVRRLQNRAASFAQTQALARAARRLGLKTHLDGARLFIAAAAQGVPARRYAALFDTVYVSLYKYLGCPAGAVLAGPTRLLAPMREERRAWGGSPAESYLLAAPALAELPRAAARLRRALGAGKDLLDRLRRVPGLAPEAFPDGTNVAFLRVEKTPWRRFKARLAKRGVELGRYDAGRGAFFLQFNETILRRGAAALARDFREAAR